ncbi:MAG TPA: FAD-binding protein [Anaerolineaceae bacterium]|nr:FAD-binding protein [Anaerolineaceae bacterium]
MTYTPEMMELIKVVEATRPQRVGQRFPSMTMEEREQVLNSFHPDYIKANMREIRVGVNKGSRMPLELADVLEGRPRVSPDFDLSQPEFETDVLIVGGGGAGSCAALLADEGGTKVTLVTKLRLGDANTMMAQGGIQAADRPEDSPAIHYLDVLGGGHFSNFPDLVEALVKDAPEVIQWLENLGAMFDKLPDGSMYEEHGGGTSKKRMHCARDYTGAEIMRTLRDEVRNRSNIEVIEFCAAVELVLDDNGKACGAILYNMETEHYLYVRAKAVVLATGGSGRLHYQNFPTTNHFGATGDGLVMAYRVGANLTFLDTMQYHPTGAAYPEQILGQLVTEKVRSLGAQPVNIKGEQFVYPLEPRDVEAAAFIRECSERDLGITTSTGLSTVWLDTPMIDLIHGPGTVYKALPAMARQYKRFNIDMAKEPILVYPTLHYQNGGARINVDCSTGVPGLFMAGEVSGGVHGRNRLMGNSLLDVCVFGRRAGRAAAIYISGVTPGKPNLKHVEMWNKELDEVGLNGKVHSPVLLPNYTRVF